MSTVLTITREEIGSMVLEAAEVGSKTAEARLLGYQRTFAADDAVLSMHFTRESFAEAFAAMGASEYVAQANADHLFGILVMVKGNCIAKAIKAAS